MIPFLTDSVEAEPPTPHNNKNNNTYNVIRRSFIRANPHPPSLSVVCYVTPIPGEGPTRSIPTPPQGGSYSAGIERPGAR